MLINTKDNPSIRKELIRRMADLIPNCEFHLYDQSAHWPQYGQHELFNEHWADFITDHQ